MGLAALGYATNRISQPIEIGNGEEGGGGSGVKKDIPILAEDEAELLNDLNLTPLNMKEIFRSDNPYAIKFNMKDLTHWESAISMFLTNLTVNSCYENRLLLTNSECDVSKCFLYSIRDYLENATANNDLPTGISMNEDTSDFNELSLEHDGDIVLSHDRFEPPKYRTEDNKPYVNVGAIEKRTNKRHHFKLKLSEDSKKEVNSLEPTDSEITEIKQKFEDIQQKYSGKYVMYMY